MSRPSLIVGSAVLMLAAVAFVLWLASTGETSLPEGVSSDRNGESESIGLSGDLQRSGTQLSLTDVGADRSAVVGEGEFDPELQEALCGFT